MQSADMAEERRLFYVGVSRSKGRLILLGAERRAEVMHSPSPYLKDIIEGLPVDRVVVFGPMRDVKLAAVPVQAYKPRQDEPSLAAAMRMAKFRGKIVLDGRSVGKGERGEIRVDHGGG